MTVKRTAPEVSTEVIQVIRVTFLRGDGKTTIMRNVNGYFTFDGSLLAEDDPCRDNDKVDPMDRRS